MRERKTTPRACEWAARTDVDRLPGGLSVRYAIVLFRILFPLPVWMWQRIDDLRGAIWFRSELF